jgi:UDP-N-acetylmuramoyl-tripeptide--D-alanyl-D-alanine ligase
VEFTLREIQKVTEANVLKGGLENFWGVSIDSRTCGEGQLFVALRGKRTDGHHFVFEALDRGAHGAMVEKWDEGKHFPATLFVVPDTYLALIRLGKYASFRLRGKRIGVAGAAGKTTCKHVVSYLLGRCFKVAMTPQSFNTPLGVSLSFANFPEDASFIVAEAGINTRGEMEMLSALIRPEVVIFTAFGEEHLEGLGSKRGALEEELKLLWEGTERVYVNVDGDVPEREEVRKYSPRALVIPFGCSKKAFLRLLSFHLNTARLTSRFRIVVGGKIFSLEAPILAPETVLLALPAIHLSFEAGLSWKKIEEALQALRELPGRGGFFCRGNGVIIDDTYNANPLSCRKAVRLLSKFALGGYRTCLVLGDMLELGDATDRAHREILRRVWHSPIERVLLLGPFLGEAAQKEFCGVWGERFLLLASPEEGKMFLRNFAASSERWAVLLKGSRGMGLETVMPEEWRGEIGG